MEEKRASIDVLLERAMEYTRTSITLFKLKSVDRISELLSRAAVVLVLVVIVLLFFVNLNIGIAILIGDCLGQIWLGFLIVSGFYALLGVVFFLFRDRLIKRRVTNSIISQLLGKEIPGDEQNLE